MQKDVTERKSLWLHLRTYDVVGLLVGESVGISDGVSVGALLGTSDGTSVGACVGASDGASDGVVVGTSLGASDGDTEGATVGLSAGVEVGASDGDTDGASVGTADGASVGESICRLMRSPPLAPQASSDSTKATTYTCVHTWVRDLRKSTHSTVRNTLPKFTLITV